ncbi:hypothetical protein J0S82_012237, partial [Galemys pyrenaicus]
HTHKQATYVLIAWHACSKRHLVYFETCITTSCWKHWDSVEACGILNFMKLSLHGTHMGVSRNSFLMQFSKMELHIVWNVWILTVGMCVLWNHSKEKTVSEKDVIHEKAICDL